MSDFVTIVRAKKDLYFTSRGKPRILYMKKGDLKVCVGIRTVQMGYKAIEHNDKNFRWFIPIDFLGVRE